MLVRFKIPYPGTEAGKKQWNRDYSTNAYWAGKPWAVRRRDAQFWHELVQLMMRQQKVPQRIFEKPVEIRFFWNDRLDVDNHAVIGKLIVDAMKGWVIKGDTRRYFRRCVHDFHEEEYILVEVTDEICFCGGTCRPDGNEPNHCAGGR